MKRANFGRSRRLAHLFGFHHDVACRGFAGCAWPRVQYRLTPKHWYKK